MLKWRSRYCAQDFAEGPLAQQNLDAGANMLIPVPEPLGGVIVIGESVIAYFAEGQAMKVTPIKQTIIRVQSTAACTPGSACCNDAARLTILVQLLLWRIAPEHDLMHAWKCRRCWSPLAAHLTLFCAHLLQCVIAYVRQVLGSTC